MTFTGDKYMRCNDKKCGKTTRHVRCPNCRGNKPAFTQCGNRCHDGYKCENGVNDQWHG